MKLEHSPGSWRIATGEDALPNRWAVVSADGHKVCTVESYPSGTTGKTDAELIARAPDMMAENERLRDALRDLLALLDRMPEHAAILDACAALRAT